jgi:hypothetical protein
VVVRADLAVAFARPASQPLTQTHAPHHNRNVTTYRLKLQAFHKFADTTEALSAAAAICDGSLDKTLSKFLRTQIVDKELKGKLAVMDAKLGGLVKEKLGIKCVHDAAVAELMRGIRGQLDART